MRTMRGWYRRLVTERFLVKFILSYSVVICLTVFLTNAIVAGGFVRSIQEEERRQQSEALRKWKADAERKLRAVEELVQKMYLVDQGGLTAVEALAAPERSGDGALSLNVLRSAGAIAEEVLDLALIRADTGRTYYASALPNRSLLPGYDLSQNPLLQEVKRSGDKMRIVPSPFQDYTVSFRQRPAVTFVGTLLDIGRLPAERPVGYYLINLGADAFTGVLQEAGSPVKGEYRITDRDGRTLLDTSFASGEAEGGGTPEGAERTRVALRSDARMTFDRASGDRTQSVTLEPYGWTLEQRFPLAEAGEARIEALQRRQTLIVGLSLACAMTAMLFISRLFTLRMKRLMRSMRKVREGVLDAPATDRSPDEIGQLSQTFAEMCERLKAYIDQVYVAEIRSKNAEIAALQYQIDPHFLFNTLEALRMKALDNGDAEVSDMISLLGGLFRWNVKSKAVVVELDEELDYIESYLKLQQMRYNGGLDIAIEVGEGLGRCGFLKLCLQPLVENAVAYGIDAASGRGRVTIVVRLWEGALEVTVADDGPGMDRAALAAQQARLDAPQETDEAGGVGLRNAHQRLRLTFGEPYGLRLRSEPGRGAEATLTLPILTAEEMRNRVQHGRGG